MSHRKLLVFKRLPTKNGATTKEVCEYDKYLQLEQMLSCSIVRCLVVPAFKINATLNAVICLEADQFMEGFAKFGIEHSINHGIYEAVHVA